MEQRDKEINEKCLRFNKLIEKADPLIKEFFEIQGKRTISYMKHFHTEVEKNKKLEEENKKLKQDIERLQGYINKLREQNNC